jgi:hypothetical protein
MSVRNLIHPLWATVKIYTDPKEQRTRAWVSGRRPILGQVEEYERLRSADQLTLHRPRHRIAGNLCHFLEARTGVQTNRVWLDPSRGYQMVKQEILEYGKRTYAVWDVVCQQIEGVWFPMEKKFQYLNTHGGWTENRQHLKGVRFTRRSDHGGNSGGQFRAPGQWSDQRA